MLHSLKLRLHAACSDAVAIEVLARQLASLGSGPGALLSLCPWLEFITIPTQARGVMAGLAAGKAWQLNSAAAPGQDRGAHCTRILQLKERQATTVSRFALVTVHIRPLAPPPPLIPQLEDQWSEVLLTSLYNITAQQAERQAYEVGHCNFHRSLCISWAFPCVF